ncbi:hypothetical protein LTR15_002621 [Elasticomyces elasticus]|nr:hypothetical protein LTR15_002621 [Elasticomyces elasticus]
MSQMRRAQCGLLPESAADGRDWDGTLLRLRGMQKRMVDAQSRAIESSYLKAPAISPSASPTKRHKRTDSAANDKYNQERITNDMEASSPMDLDSSEEVDSVIDGQSSPLASN